MGQITLSQNSLRPSLSLLKKQQQTNKKTYPLLGTGVTTTKNVNVFVMNVKTDRTASHCWL